MNPRHRLHIVDSVPVLGPVTGTSVSLTAASREAPRWPFLAAALMRRRNLAVLGGAVLVVLGAGVLGMTAAASAFLGIGTIAYATLVERDRISPTFARLRYGALGPPLRPDVSPDEITPDEIRASYLGVVRAPAVGSLALGDAGDTSDALRDVYGRCGELVSTAGRIALSAKFLHAHLQAHRASEIEAEIARLDALAGSARDELAASAYRRAAATRREQLSVYHQIEGHYERVKARLHVINACLTAVQANGVKLRALGLEGLEAAEATIAESLDCVRSDLDILEASMSGALAA
jgi:hypothetical protein